jgi:prepilin-type N-terminal cleavage/methylation domain-containing protein
MARQSLARPGHSSQIRPRAFTLIELLVVIVIIAVLMGLAFPVFQAVQNSAKKTQAKIDLVQIVTAVNAYYTEYGKYPIVSNDDVISNTSDIFYTLRAIAQTGSANASDAANPRKIVFFSPPDAKDNSRPRSGIAPQDATLNGITIRAGELIDPWGIQYKICINGTYDNDIANPYGGSGGAGTDPIHGGVIAWSFGKNGVLGGGNALNSNFSKEGGSVNVFTGSGDVISWQ